MTHSQPEKNLTALLANMSPVLDPHSYVFCHASTDIDLAPFSPKCLFWEQEGVTLILERSQAQRFQFDCNSEYACITLNVHSSLEAVGLTAAVSTALAEQGISANVVAAYFHDHIFVGVEDAQRAIDVLTALSAKHSVS